jgi:hypothetical protein
MSEAIDAAGASPELPATPAVYSYLREDLLDKNWRERDGLLGLFNGRQSLALAFWGLGVCASLIMTVVFMPPSLLRNGHNEKAIMAWGIVSIAVTRMCAWYAIIRCRRNTTSELLSALALVAVALDMVFGLITWPIALLVFTY